jgi:hypothetical protein
LDILNTLKSKQCACSMHRLNLATIQIKTTSLGLSHH